MKYLLLLAIATSVFGDYYKVYINEYDTSRRIITNKIYMIEGNIYIDRKDMYFKQAFFGTVSTGSYTTDRRYLDCISVRSSNFNITQFPGNPKD